MRASPRTQASIAISSDGSRWCLINASPDLRQQLQSLPAAPTNRATRTAALGAVMLTDAELDHTAGLLSLRESGALPIHASEAVFAWLFKANPVFGALIDPSRLIWRPVVNHAFGLSNAVEEKGAGTQSIQITSSAPNNPILASDGTDLGLRYEAFFVPGKVPRYVGPAPASADGSTLAYLLGDARGDRSLLYMPCVRAIDDTVRGTLSRADIVLFDGSFWSDDEMERCGVGTATARAMGHIPIGGPDGSLATLRELGAVRKIYTHLNNTNPILDEDSAERRTVNAAGFEIARDGMELDL
jgi:pyrroloquinoline quinone biosynthesis protein B